MKKRPWLIFLVFPIVGLVGMVVILLGGRATPTPTTNQIRLAELPSPVPIRVTSVPTVTPVLILDNLAPLHPLTDFEGKTFTLGDFTDQVVIINFWATWCPPCVEEMPLLEAYAAAHPNITVLAVTDPNDGQTLEQVQAFIEEYQLEHLQFGLDQDGRLRVSLNGLNLPMTFVLDQQNYVRFRQIGQVTEEDLDYYVSEVSS